MTDGEVERIDHRTLQDLHKRIDLLYAKIDTEVSRVEQATFAKLDAEMNRVSRGLEGIQQTLSGRVFVRQDVFDEIREADRKWREIQEESQRENREWRAKMNLALITATGAFIAQAIFFLLTRK